jgi:outer membrane murein-binding lipoprotein Lpp
MLEKLSRLFVGSPSLEVKLQETSDSRMELQGEVRALRAEVARLQEEVTAAREAERTAYQMLINVDHQLKYGFAPYPDAPKLPEDKLSLDNGGPVNSGWVHGRQLVDAAKDENRAAMDTAIFGEQ